MTTYKILGFDASNIVPIVPTQDDIAKILGNLEVDGNLTVSGTTTTINSTTVQIDDLNVQLGDGSVAASAVNNGGITLANTDANITWQYNHASTAWKSNIDIDAASGNSYKIAGTTVLSASTLGSGVTASSLTSVGTLSSGTWNATAIAVAYGGTGATTASGARTNLGLVIGTDVQAYHADLDNLSGMETGASAALALLTQAEIEILDGALVSTTELNILNGVTATTTELNYLDGASANINTLALPANTTISDFGKTLVDDADAASARSTLLLGSIATQAADNVNIDGGAIDDAVIGANSAAAGTFTALAATSLDMNGNIDMSGASREITLNSSDADALVFKQGSDAYLEFDTNDRVLKAKKAIVADDGILLSQNTAVEVAQGVSFVNTSMNFAAGDGSSASVSAYHLLAISDTNELAHADADGADYLYNVIGIALEDGPTAASAEAKQAMCMVGQLAPMYFASAPSASDVGKPVFLSETAGEATLTAPTTSGSKIFRVGFLVSESEAIGGTSTYSVLFQPQFMAIA